ncbi:LemA family protein [Fontisphaera persica]|uniref:LemA family protein n=1 Tax=Fontisphaera persica TaxID=2974023 RepID=UPI0024C03655|nr:LemA family protein [Fontisphaera persica]WCJ58700.1 LemA family protein [Fontisphaera persica]
MYDAHSPELWPVLTGSLLALVCLGLSLRANHRRRLVDNIPTSKTSGVFIGLVEIQGTAETHQPLRSFLAEIPCVHYQYEVAEHWSRTVTETYTDSKGHRQTRTRHESGWKTVDSGGQMIPFFLKDDYGAVLVRPEGATLEPKTVFSTVCGRTDPLYYAKGPAWAVANSDHRRRFTEQAIPLHAPIYVMGQARERQDVVAPEIAADKNAPMFLISTRTEKEISRGYGWAWYGWNALGLLFAAGGAAWSFGATASPVLAAGAAVILYLALLFVGWMWVVFNSMVDLRNRVQQAWSLVDVQLKRRHDLIPNLLAAVSGLRNYERDVQETLALLRAQMQATAPGQPGPDPAAVGQRLVALAEHYPELKAHESFLRLQRELADTETRIALARGYYNDIATHHNLRLELIPDRFLARLAGLQPRPLMAANDFQRPPVLVEAAPPAA